MRRSSTSHDPFALRRVREAKGLSLRDLEQLSGINKGQLSRVERGAGLTPRNALLLADALDVDLRWLLEHLADRREPEVVAA